MTRSSAVIRVTGEPAAFAEVEGDGLNRGNEIRRSVSPGVRVLRLSLYRRRTGR
jgi:hypothetical protein